ncbi:hypothetical protein [Neptuniibacter halophilus]|uniref:hypothetical protein n=1 Tax=Neptuniibacter halophilus TaxID=651666 RepID=UPI002573533F|nr:hypothetical protein [Neptuniibacter halophilus]
MAETILFLFIGLVVYLNIVATYHLNQSELYSLGQKRAQFFLIWLIPLVGASLVIMMLMEEIKAKRHPKGQTFIMRFLMLSFIFADASSNGSSPSDSNKVESTGGDGGGGD